MKQMSVSHQGHVVQPALACVHLAFLDKKSNVILYYMLRMHAFICIENVPGYVCNHGSQREQGPALENARGMSSAISSSESYV